MMISRSRIAFTVIAFALVACSSAPPDSPLQGEVNPAPKKKQQQQNNDDSEADNTGTTTNQNGTDPLDPSNPATPATPATPAPATPAPANGQCSASASFAACFQCCDQAAPGGFDVESNAFGQCACEAPGVCAQACAGSFCAGGQPTPACEQCLTAATQCNTAAETACNANASCKAAFTCFDSSGCEQKP